ncbi:twin-arginine translocation signal domain-containing protein [Pseudomonas sp. B21-012]|uniref:pyoverdine maturation tyrosinase PvdP n=1 Tax=unclassified Pseudomonas TaxID=196821 RepID=UPI001BCF376A|nr:MULTISPECIES: twin-arginine translocation signal domain-containing protein [unclassified Pseudomonas]QVM95156.1 twin-arginine translocation signal domain-containing protein [Pseudomonas sp. SORT22]UVL57976.1 twin-arginine translocation signal domain-containing protein [Pseudomonas sp. B21-035]UVM57617.1 twin-arginine translocation signal domain-containing protein [Pseudomonas sp. B21-012]
MTISRRGFIAGLAVAGATVPAAYYAHKQLTHDPQDDIVTPGEASVELADAAGQHLADQLRGVWDLRLSGADGELAGLPVEGLQMYLDVAAKGRGLRGFVDTELVLRSDAPAAYRVLGDLVGASTATVRWRLMSTQGGPGYECTASLDEVWGSFGNAGSATLSGRLQPLDRSMVLPLADSHFVAVKRLFPEARERLPYTPQLQAWLISAEHRLFHQLWHATRDKWHRLSEEKHGALRGLGWQPGPRDKERDARGPRKHRNGSGVDFLFMHRHMLGTARSMQDLPSWPHFPLPQPSVEHDRQGFARYYDNHDGYCVPPGWRAPGDEAYGVWVSAIKAGETFCSNFQVWESQYQDPLYLSKLTLGAFGSELEMNLHDWLHMCWASVPRDPVNGAPVPFARDPADFAGRWYEAENDFLGDPFSSHVNPVFWGFHGWIDDRIEDWYRAHERYNPGQVRRLEVNGVQWFAPGRWVEVDDPWLGPVTHGCSTTPGMFPGKSVEMDVEIMKLALRITFGEDDKIGDLVRRVPQRPWYARHLSLRGIVS